MFDEEPAGDPHGECAMEIKSLEKIVCEFLADPRVCLAIAKDCMGGHQEDPCKCLYCRAKSALSSY